MTPKEKVKELYVKYYELIESPYEKHKRTKQCALIAVDEILKIAPMMYKEDFDSGDFTIKEYYQEVKQEIEKL